MFDVQAHHDQNPDVLKQWLQDLVRRSGHQVRSHGDEVQAQAAAGGQAQRVFTRLTLSVPEELREPFRQFDPPAAEERLLQAARALLAKHLPRAQGVYAVLHEPGRPAPTVVAILSPRLDDGGATPLVTRAEIANLQDAWGRSLQRNIGLRPPAQLGPDEQRALERWQERSEGLLQVTRDAMNGDPDRNAIETARRQAQLARENLEATRRPAETARVTPILTLRLENGGTFLSRLDAQDLQRLLSSAARQATGRNDLDVLAFRSGREREDLELIVPYNQDTERLALPQLEFRDRLLQGLPQAVRDLAPEYDPEHRGTVGELGRAVLPALPAETRQEPPARKLEADAAGTIPVEDRTLPVHDPERPEARIVRGMEWLREPFHTVQFRLGRGAQVLEQLPLEKRQDALQEAVDRAYPFLSSAGIRNNFHTETDGPALKVSVHVPASLGHSREALSAAVYQYRFASAFYRGAVQRGAAFPARGDLTRGALQAAAGPINVVRTAQRVAHMTDDPGRAAAHQFGQAWDRLVNCAPPAFSAPAKAVTIAARTALNLGREE